MSQESSTMEQLRANLLRRAHMERHGNSADLEAGNNQPNMHESHPIPNPNRTLFSRLFPRLQGQSTNQSDDNENETVKSDESSLRRHRRRLAIPAFLTPWTNRSNHPLAQDSRQITDSPAPLLPMSQTSHMQSQTSPIPPEPIASPDASRWSRRSRRERERPVDPLEVHLAEILGVPSARRRRGRSDRERQRIRRRTGETSHPAKFLCCFPWVRSRHVRAQIIRCIVSGLFLVTLVTVYLTLSLTNSVSTSEMSIMLILVILFATILFFHGLIRLYLLVIRKQREAAIRANRPPRYRGHTRYAVPPHPIHVVLARDEEVVGMETEATKAEPPAYGLWRETVRVDPNRLFWQRNEDVDMAQIRPGTCVSQRPPSYISEDGVAYVMEAVPRSTAPVEDIQLPPHPSEMGRLARVPTN